MIRLLPTGRAAHLLTDQLAALPVTPWPIHRNFQEWPLQLVQTVLQVLHFVDGTLVVPQTVRAPEYAQENPGTY